MSITREIVEIVTDSLAEYPGSSVTSVTLRIGVHSGVVPEAIWFCFPLASEGTQVEGATLEIETVPLRVRCHECCTGPVETESMQCPACGSTRISVESGRELDISAIDLELREETDVARTR